MLRTKRLACLPALLAIAWPLQTLAGDVDYDAIADNLVNQSLEVQPGEVIIITGNRTEIDLMAALQVAVAKAGGQPVLQLNIPEAAKRVAMEAPLEHLKRLPTANLLMARAADGFINVGSVADPDLFADVPEERLAAIRQASTPLNASFRTARFRSVALGQTGGIPTEAYAASQDADYEAMKKTFWQALEVSPEQLEAAGETVTGALQPGASVQLKSDAGTDLKFRIDNTPARINAGRTADVVQTSGPASVWLPAGEAYACIDGASATGTVVVPHMTFRGKPVEDLKMKFKNGELTDLTAKKNAKMLREFFAASSANAGTPSVIDIGLNTKSAPPKGSKYRSWEMGGMITLAVGNNGWAGGNNDADGGLTMHLSDTSLSVEREVIVSNGQLSTEVLAAFKR